MSYPMRLHRNEEPERPDAGIDAVDAAREQGNLAEAALYDEAFDWLHLPWRTLDALVGGIGKGNVWFVGGFSGHGKTTFLMDLSCKLLEDDRVVYYVGTESKPNELRTRLACQRVGVYSGHVLNGTSRGWNNWPEIRAQLVADIHAQIALRPRSVFLVAPVTRINAVALRGAFHDAARSGAEVLIIDHIDHIEHGQGRNGFEDSRMLAHLVLDLAQETKLRVIVATQFNNEGGRGDVLGMYQPPRPHYVYMGGHKRQIAWGMLGVYRPLRDDITPEELKQIRAGVVQAADCVEPDVMAVSIMKHRYLGGNEGKRVRLRFDHGRLSDMPEKDQYATSYERRVMP